MNIYKYISTTCGQKYVGVLYLSCSVVIIPIGLVELSYILVNTVYLKFCQRFAFVLFVHDKATTYKADLHFVLHLWMITAPVRAHVQVTAAGVCQCFRLILKYLVKFIFEEFGSRVV